MNKFQTRPLLEGAVLAFRQQNPLQSDDNVFEYTSELDQEVHGAYQYAFAAKMELGSLPVDSLVPNLMDPYLDETLVTVTYGPTNAGKVEAKSGLYMTLPDKVIDHYVYEENWAIWVRARVFFR